MPKIPDKRSVHSHHHHHDKKFKQHFKNLEEDDFGSSDENVETIKNKKLANMSNLIAGETRQPQEQSRGKVFAGSDGDIIARFHIPPIFESEEYRQ